MDSDFEKSIPTSEIQSNSERPKSPVTPETAPVDKIAIQVDHGLLQTLQKRLEGKLDVAQAIVDEVTTVLSKPTNISRRGFLKLSGAVSLLALLCRQSQAPTPPTAPEQTPRVEKEQSNLNILIIDITKDTFANFEKYDLPNISEKELAKRLGIKRDLTIEELKKKVPEDEELQLAVLAQIMKLYYGGHGREVASAMEQVDKFLEKKGATSDVASLSAGVVKNLEVKRDEIGNPTFWVELDNEELVKVISQSSQKFVNLSLELGRVGIEFKMFTTVRANPDAINPMTIKQLRTELVQKEEGVYSTRGVYQLPDGTEIGQEEYDKLWEKCSETKVVPRESIDFIPIDAYGEGGNPLESLARLANVAARFPDKIFFAAAGNPSERYGQPNILGAKEDLVKRDKWPSNLIMIGYWGAEYDEERYPSGYGADYYIRVDDLNRLGLSWATSFATPVAERIVADYFSQKGIEPTSDRAREVLNKYSQIEEIGTVWDFATEQHFEDQVLKIIDLGMIKKDLGDGKEKVEEMR